VLAVQSGAHLSYLRLFAHLHVAVVAVGQARGQTKPLRSEPVCLRAPLSSVSETETVAETEEERQDLF